MPCYNCSSTLEEAVNSCYTQGFSDSEFEIVMVDDCSTDNTRTIMKRLSNTHTNIKTLFHEKNKGGGATRNTAVAHSAADLIFCLDSDDLLFEKSLLPMYKKIIRESLDAVCLGKMLSFKGKDIHDISHVTTFPSDKEYVLEDLIERTHSCGLNAVFMFTKHAFEKAGGYPTSHGFDTQGFAWRFLAHGLKAQSCREGIYHHRVSFHQSYYLREYAAGMTNFNMASVIAEHEYLLNTDATQIIQEANLRDFTLPIINQLKKLPKVFTNNAYELTQKIPDHTHDKIISQKPVPLNSITGLYFRIKRRIRKY